ncbi:Asp23/Gls24 family envelope stress response protein [Rathayibacter sp. VKM Ac-2856]|uniref:Asp23/Gls24 family envelope stress response protein n=1 Tax=unclassified Rathayibacter TaxID=2609250 RepID=UPI00156308E9|nr:MULTISPECIES: Asp23/Gls24 family envelope stress response protein [unclassified Rathayibacter]NQX05244.1 Asp23/Gls24 family envelope stress response protein [Rathayibacter sp. VKM Ac-2858]NQX20881.1 Asp23/Gls24 family envelope stress response protein [Rathayibacter sp. VKM Ac-2856]
MIDADDAVPDDGVPESAAPVDPVPENGVPENGVPDDSAPENDAPENSAPENSVPDDDLDGHTLEELSEYLDRGRTPVDPSIEGSAACRLALANLTRLTELSAGALRRRADEEPDRDEVWIAGLLDAIRSEVRSGRDVPIRHPDPTLRLALTEAAVRGMIRRAGDTMGGVIMGRCTLDGEVATPGAVIRIDVTFALEFGIPIATVADRLRERIRYALERHTELVVGAIDVTVDDVYPSREDGE